MTPTLQTLGTRSAVDFSSAPKPSGGQPPAPIDASLSARIAGPMGANPSHQLRRSVAPSFAAESGTEPQTLQPALVQLSRLECFGHRTGANPSSLAYGRDLASRWGEWRRQIGDTLDAGSPARTPTTCRHTN
jgi:hypothetical protein